MPQRQAVERLPEIIRADLNSRLIAGSFSGYEQLSAWLGEQGFRISKSALHRYGEKFEERCEALKIATDQAKAIVLESPDDEGAMNEALIRLVQEKSFHLLMNLEIDPKTIDFPKLVRAIADAARTSVVQKKFQIEAAARKAERNEIEQKIEGLAKGALKLDANALNLIRRAIRGDSHE